MNTRIAGSFVKAAGIVIAPLSMLLASVPASAQNDARLLFEWRGTVDQEVRIQMQNGRTDVMPIGPRESVGYDDAVRESSVPSINGYVTVRMLEGRGVADVVQQPRSQNGYTAIIRIRDEQSGRGQYDVQAFWQPDGNYAARNYSGYGGRVYDDGGYYSPYYDPYYDPYYPGAYGGYGAFGGYYGAYPRTVIVEPPVRRPVYVERRAEPRVVPVPSEPARRVFPPGFPTPRTPVSRAPAASAPIPHAVRTPPPPPPPAPARSAYHHQAEHHGRGH